MDEKHFDRGFDYPRSFSPETLAKLAFALLPPPDFFQAFLLSLLSLLACFHAHATSFGPLPLTAQMNEAPYIYQGKIRGRWVELNKTSQKPYTFWNLVDVEILKSIDGEQVRETVLRQPGGEMGNMGYRVSGSAEFVDGEEVIVFAKGTEDPKIKEVMGLAGGKYAVELTEGGKKTLRNGIGFTATDSNGNPLSIEAFKQILSRVQQQVSTDEDNRIVFNTQGNHQHNETHSFPDHFSSPLNATTTPKSPPSSHAISEENPPNHVQKHEPLPDTSLTGLQEERSWIFVIFAVALTAFIAGTLWMVFRRK